MSIPAWAIRLPWNVIFKMCASRGIDPLLVASIMHVESGGRPGASRFEAGWKYYAEVEGHAERLGVTPETERIHQATSWGLMQVMGGTARDLGYLDDLPKLTRIQEGVQWGCEYLVRLKKKHPVLTDLISAYNAGRPTTSNLEYVRSVMARLNEIK